MRNTVLLRAAIFPVPATHLCGCGSSLAREASARVLKADGLNFVTEPKPESKERPLKEESPVMVGEKIHSGSDGRVALSLLPGALLELEPNSKLAIEKLTITNGFGFPKAQSWSSWTSNRSQLNGASRLGRDRGKDSRHIGAGKFAFRAREREFKNP